MKEKERAEKEVVDERAKFGPIPVSDKANKEEELKVYLQIFFTGWTVYCRKSVLHLLK